MLDDRDPASLSAEDVEEVLAALDRLAPGLAPGNRDTFAFNVLVNALGTVIERIRRGKPDLVPTYLAAAHVIRSRRKGLDKMAALKLDRTREG